MPKGNISEIKCRHCGRTIKATGFWHHLTAAHRGKAFSYEKELEAHGISRASPGQKWHQGAGPAPAPPSQIMGTQPALEPAAPIDRENALGARLPRENGRLTITREALELALSGLERVKGELDAHIADVRATLEPPRRKYMTKKLVAPDAAAGSSLLKRLDAYDDHANEWRKNPPGHPKGTPGSAWLPRQHSRPVATYTYIKGPNRGGSRKVWSNDPEGKYRHFADTGEIMRKASDGKPWEKSPMTPAVLDAIKKARAARWQ